MAQFLVDEDLPLSLAHRLRELRHQAQHVRELGLRGHSDDEIFAAAQERQAILLTSDLDFASIVRFPLGEHTGIVVARLPDEWSIGMTIEEILRGLATISEATFAGNLAIIEPGRVRIRRAEQ